MEEKMINRNNANTNIRQEKLKEINKYLNDEGVDLYDPQVMRTLLECIKVIDKRNIEFQFKCNLNIRERIEKAPVRSSSWLSFALQRI